MKRKNFLTGSWLIMGVLVGLGVAVSPTSGGGGSGADITLEDANSTAVWDLDSSAGQKDWTVDEVDHMTQQWFWYRVGSEGSDREYSIDTLTQGTPITMDTNGSGEGNLLFVEYTSAAPSFTVSLTFLLTGGTTGSGNSDIMEVIKVENTGSDSLDFHLFQYCDFDLKATPDDDTVQISGGNAANQTDPTHVVTETVATWKPDHFDVGEQTDIRDLLEDAAPTTLGDDAGPLGPGNVTWAFQWDKTIAAGGSLLISKDKNVTPEPATLALMGLGGLGLLLGRKRQ